MAHLATASYVSLTFASRFSGVDKSAICLQTITRPLCTGQTLRVEVLRPRWTQPNFESLEMSLKGEGSTLTKAVIQLLHGPLRIEIQARDVSRTDQPLLRHR